MEFNFVDMLLYIVNLIILFFVLKHFVYKPVSKFLSSRKESVSKEIDTAANDLQQAQEARAKYEALLENSKNEAAEIVAKGRERADKVYAEAVEQGRAEARQIVQRAFAEIQREKKAAYENMRDDIADMAIGVAERILKREISQEDNRRIIDEFFEKVV